MKKMNFKTTIKCLLLVAPVFTLIGCSSKTEVHLHGADCDCDECITRYALQNETIKQDKLLRQGASLGNKRTTNFVTNNTTEFKIVIPASDPTNDDDNNLNYCAEQLSTYIQLVSKANFKIITDDKVTYNASDKVISIGHTIYQKQLVKDVDYSKLTTGGYFVRNYNDIYILDSECKEGRLYATYEFLSNFFHVEFLAPDDTQIPSLNNVEAYDINYLTTPAFDIRDYYYYPVWYQGIAWGAKIRNNSSSYKINSKVNGNNSYKYYAYYYTKADGTVGFSTREGHTIQELLAVDAYNKGLIETPDKADLVTAPSYKTSNYGATSSFALGYYRYRPDFYGQNVDTRANSNGDSQEEICYSNGIDDNGDWIVQDHDATTEANKNLVTLMSEIVAEMVINEPSQDAYYLMLGHADYPEKCNCSKCKAAYTKYGGFGGTTAVWENAVVREAKNILAKKGCNREFKIVMFAYSKSIDAPVKTVNGNLVPISPKVVLDEDIVCKMAYRNCVYHSLWDESCTQNEVLRDRFNGWMTIAKSFVIWDYTDVFTDHLFYLPNFGTIQDNYKYYQSIGVKHLLSQGSPNEYRYYESQLHAWVLSQMMWDPDLNINQLIKRYNNLMFTERYAKYVNDYRMIMDNYYAYRDATHDGGFHATTTYELDMTNADTYDINVLLQAAEVLEKGIKAVRNDTTLTDAEKDTIELRLRSAKITPQYMMLSMNMVVDELEKNRIAKDFFESIDKLKLTYRCEGSITANSFEEMKKGYDLD